MATFTAQRGLDMLSVQTTDGTVSFSTTLITVRLDATHYTTFTGVGFVPSQTGGLAGGTLNGVEIVDGTPLLTISDASIPALDFYNYAQAEDLVGLYNALFAGNDVFSGSAEADNLLSAGGNDTLTGGGGADTLAGGAGNDTYVVGAGDTLTELPGGGTDTVQSALTWTLSANVEKLTLIGSNALNGTGNTAVNTLTGNSGANVLSGLGGADTLLGMGGNDTLKGGAGNDTLNGGGGNDAFVFDTALNRTGNVDRIADFVHGSDRIRLDDDVFAGLNASLSNALTSAQFRSGAGINTAADADDRILYDTTTGTLYYDADGTGTAKAAVAFAVLSNHAAITAADFMIIA